MVFDGEDDDLLQKLVAHQELLAGSRDISVTVLDSHAGETSLLHLEGDKSRQIHGDLCFLGWVHTWVGSGSENIETFVTNLVDHF